MIRESVGAIWYVHWNSINNKDITYLWGCWWRGACIVEDVYIFWSYVFLNCCLIIFLTILIVAFLFLFKKVLPVSPGKFEWEPWSDIHIDDMLIYTGCLKTIGDIFRCKYLRLGESFLNFYKLKIVLREYNSRKIKRLFYLSLNQGSWWSWLSI